MKIGGWQTLCLVLLLGCLTSFAWAMARFFLRPAGRTTGMWATAFFGTAFAILHAGALLWPGSVTRGRGYFASAMYLSALSLFWWAIATNRRQPLSAIFSPDVPVHLMTAGPYRMVRHPFYCAYLLVWFAGLVATRLVAGAQRGSHVRNLPACGPFRGAKVPRQRLGPPLPGLPGPYRAAASESMEDADCPKGGDRFVMRRSLATQGNSAE